MTHTTDKDLYTAYAESAPRLDLAFYVDYAQRHRDAYSVATRAIVSEMVAYVDELVDQPRGSTSVQKRLVWDLIRRFKASIPAWSDYGSWQDADARLAVSTIALWVTNGARSVLLDPQTPAIEAAQRGEQPLTIQEPKAPTWRARAIAAEAKAQELHARLQRYQERAAQSPDPRVNAINTASTSRPVRPEKVHAPISTVGTRVCRTCAAEQPIDQFTYGDGGRTVRSMCRTCRKTQQQQRTRRPVAA